MPNHREGWIKPFNSRIKDRYVVTDSGCWEWQRATNSDGYPVVASYRQTLKVHRLMMMGYGPIPNWLLVRHICFNKRCINPEHLRLGTDRDNLRDADRAKLTPELAEYIRTSKKSSKELAKEMPVGLRQVQHVRAGSSWNDDAR